MPRHFGAYEVAETLEDGKFAKVYRCRDHDLNRRLVVKRFNPNCRVGDYPPEFWRARFLMEARAMAVVDCEFVAPVLSFARTESSTPYFVLPWYPDSLKARLGSDKSSPEEIAKLSERRRPKCLPLRDSVRIAAQILIGLDAIHQEGTVHRDIKPANILLTKAASSEKNSRPIGDVRIVDFGLAMHPNLRLTRHEGWLGTEGYMSPEQRRKTADADIRTDVFAVGVVFYRMLAGALPVGRPSPINETTDASPALAEWMSEMLATDRDARPPTAEAAVRRLREAYGPTAFDALTGL